VKSSSAYNLILLIFTITLSIWLAEIFIKKRGEKKAIKSLLSLIDKFLELIEEVKNSENRIIIDRNITSVFNIERVREIGMELLEWFNKEGCVLDNEIRKNIEDTVEYTINSTATNTFQSRILYAKIIKIKVSCELIGIAPMTRRTLSDALTAIK